MTIALGDLLRVIDYQEYLDQECLNVYYYRSVNVTPMSNDTYPIFASWFEDNIIDAVSGIQNDGVTHTHFVITNMTNGIDFLDTISGTVGQVEVEEFERWPSYSSLGFRLIREVLTTRNGYKRITGMWDGIADGNLPILTGAPKDLIEEKLAADVVVGLATILEPVIVKHPVGSPPIASYDYSSIGACLMASFMGTQNTRKP